MVYKTQKARERRISFPGLPQGLILRLLPLFIQLIIGYPSISFKCIFINALLVTVASAVTTSKKLGCS
jgi:hypothetical protein